MNITFLKRGSSLRLQKRSSSLRANFLRLVVLPLLAMIILTVAIALVSIFREVDEVYDATLVQYAKVLDQLVKTDNDSDDVLALPQTTLPMAHKYEKNIYFRILRDGKPIAESANAKILANAITPPGFTDQTINGKRWRFFTLVNTDTKTQIEVAERYRIRRELTLQLLSSLAIPAALFAFFAPLMIWWGARHSLRQLVSLSSQVDRRDAHDMTTIDNKDVPQEVMPLLRALNRLLERVSESFRREREFTDNAAHELRTPLAAMKTQTQVIARDNTLSADTRDGVNNLLAAVNRSVTLVDELLSFTRLQADDSRTQNVDLGAVVADEANKLSIIAQDMAINLCVDAPSHLLVAGNSAALALLSRNIIDNALKFTPKGGRVDVTVRADEKKNIYLCVTDNGPGIPDSDKQKVFERFYRGSKSLAPGSGLGLSMVDWIAQHHGATITLADAKPHGLCLTVTFPTA